MGSCFSETEEDKVVRVDLAAAEKLNTSSAIYAKPRV